MSQQPNQSRQSSELFPSGMPVVVGLIIALAVTLVLFVISAGTTEEDREEDHRAQEELGEYQPSPEPEQEKGTTTEPQEASGPLPKLDNEEKTRIARAIIHSAEQYREAEIFEIREYLEFLSSNIQEPQLGELIAGQSDEALENAAEQSAEYAEQLSVELLLEEETKWRTGQQMVEIARENEEGEIMAFYAVYIDGEWYGF